MREHAKGENNRNVSETNTLNHTHTLKMGGGKWNKRRKKIEYT